LLAAVGVLGLAGVALAGAAPLGAVMEFKTGLNAGTAPTMGSAGPDGNVWFTDGGTTHAVGKATPDGAITEYTAGLNTGSAPFRFGREGHDGNMWFSDTGTTKAIARITPAGAITEFSAGLNTGSSPGRLAPGPDGNMWFVDKGPTKALGRITPDGTITEFPLPSTSNPNSLRTGQDGNLWFTDQGTPKAIGKLDMTTHLVTEYSAGLNAGSAPQIIETGSDGNLWFTDSGTTSAIGRIDPATGAIQEFSTGMTAGAAPNGISLGADGNIWFVETGIRKLGSITPSGTIAEYSLPAGASPAAVAAGSDGNLWFGDPGNRAIGQFGIGAPAASVTSPSVVGTDGVGVAQQCQGDTWSTWAGQQPSHDAESFDGYRWLLDGAAIAGADTASYTPTAADAGRSLSCSATVTYPLLEVTVSAASVGVQVQGASDQLAALGVAVAGSGPGKSLAAKVSQIEAYVAATDTSDACSLLGALVSEVNAQTGKSVGAADAASFLSQSAGIRAALGC
jgi:streptogramin lyase